MAIYSFSNSKYEKKKPCTRYRLLISILFMLLLLFVGGVTAQWIAGGQGGLLSSFGLAGNSGQNFQHQQHQQWPQSQNGGVLDGLLGSLGMAQNSNQLLQPQPQSQSQSQEPWNPGNQLGILGQKQGLMTDLNRLLSQGDPGHQQWRDHAQRFCAKYPQHQKCIGGKLPEFREIEGMLASIGQSVRNLVPQIPNISMNNPLSAVPFDLASLINNSIMEIEEITVKATESIQNVCQRMNCNEQKASDAASRSYIREKVLNFERMVYDKDTSQDLDMRLERTRQVKQALIERANLQGVVTPADDGVFDKDILLTTEQADFMLNELGKGRDGKRRRKRSSLFFEQEYVKKWDVSQPIKYTFHESLEEWDKNDVRMGLAEITRSVPCIRFDFIPTAPRGPHLHFMKVDSPTFCGLSYTGKLDNGNPIYLSFSCGNARGVAIHETMHALGVAHQHLRPDRDEWITVDWSNINPQHYDMFVVSDAKMFTTYGVAYDYRSIMHYNAYTAALDINKPTMMPKKDQAEMRFLGQREKMSIRDVEILKKMYCKTGACWDTNVFCGSWALKNLCRSQQSGHWMQQNCRKSCDLC